ncbi:hypothetical protein J6590_085760 [Homalodisca vitripennis]|nr:hypothetical protein J6590_085760 [Homalodisca vitripennis]
MTEAKIDQYFSPLARNSKRQRPSTSPDTAGEKLMTPTRRTRRWVILPTDKAFQISNKRRFGQPLKTGERASRGE